MIYNIPVIHLGLNFYKKKKRVIFGHWAAMGRIYRDNVIGLDTGCVYGGALSAYIVEEKAWVSVEAQRVYCPID